MTIELQGLVLFGHHGYLEEERRLGQRFLVDLWADLDDNAGSSDDIDETVDYRHLAALVREVFAGPERLLLEALATATADGVIERFPRVTTVRVRVRKPDVVLDPPVDHAAVIVERARLLLTKAFVGLGANLGPREVTLLRAVDLLGAEPGVQVLEVSALRETTPVGNVDQPEFLNGAVAVETSLSARELLNALLRVERELGRVRDGTRWGPRTIDLDLLLFGDEVVDEPGLQVPHPRLHERRFALEPLAELEPELEIPGRGKISNVLAELH